MNSGPFETVNISLPAELVAALRNTAARENRTLSGQIRHLVTQAVRLGPSSRRTAASSARPHFFHWTRIGVADLLAHLRAILVSDDQQQHQSGDPVEE